MADPVKGRRVAPEIVSPPSNMERVVDSVQALVPQAFTDAFNPPAKPDPMTGSQRVQWVRFEESGLWPPRDSGHAAPYLALGYNDGFHIYDIRAAAEVHEIYSVRDDKHVFGNVRILAAPKSEAGDRFAGQRPLLCYTSGGRSLIPSVTLMSLKTGNPIYHVGLVNDSTNGIRSSVTAIESSERVVAVGQKDSIILFSSYTLEAVGVLKDVYQSDFPLTPIALGSRWLAYQSVDDLPLESQRCTDAEESGTTQLAAKSAQRMLQMMRGTQGSPQVDQNDGKAAGSVKIVDVTDQSRTIAHFIAYAGAPIVGLKFDPSGMLLITVDIHGNNFHIYDIGNCKTMCPTQLYQLHRGSTNALIRDISFSLDSRWVACTSERGTTHLFPINPRGGRPTTRTHTSATVMNDSQFEVSAGLPRHTYKTPVVVTSEKVRSPYKTHDSHIIHGEDGGEGDGNKHLGAIAVTFGCLEFDENAGRSKDTPLTLLVCFPTGELTEFKLRAYGPGEHGKRDARSAATSRGGVVIENPDALSMIYSGYARLAGAISPTVDAMNDSTMTEGVLSVVQVVRQKWTLTRRKMDPPIDPEIGSLEPPEEMNKSRWEPENRQWLAHVEISGYQHLHRRLWSGPQFTFNIFQINAEDGFNQESIFFKDNNLSKQELPDVPLSSIAVTTHYRKARSVEYRQVGTPIVMPVQNDHNHSVAADVSSALQTKWTKGVGFDQSSVYMIGDESMSEQESEEMFPVELETSSLQSQQQQPSLRRGQHNSSSSGLRGLLASEEEEPVAVHRVSSGRSLSSMLSEALDTGDGDAGED